MRGIPCRAGVDAPHAGRNQGRGVMKRILATTVLAVQGRATRRADG
jgi:hypothetical protein